MWSLLFGIGWIGIFIMSLGTIFLALVPEYLQEINFLSMNLRIWIISISVFYFILFIKKISEISKGKEEKSFMIETETGRLEITLGSIENIIQGLLKKSTFIKDIKIKSDLEDEGVKIGLKVSVESIENLNQELQKLQAYLISYTEKLAGIKIVGIDIKIVKVHYSEKNIVELGDE
ncbi:alkaline shock response membrane anchor protein AmaP [Haliovirga abyssi]|uniref:Alkaline shock response membrane anchor protein AmaP n=1 Tax=Haliovirga abyssi TaxID=2996794 RepID=A0AAU9D685_9FUSO|nr:alkaline shock response membrane anchor protein AmaP [Haliovirga abyssi]BDU50058.1 hypothetical protein HLVA_06270 [Haliovirga abyssi]